MNESFKILILEDDADDCKQFRTYIDTLDDTVITGCTGSAEEALKLLRECPPHAVIIDLELHNGDGNGLQFISDIKKYTSDNSPFLLVTTNNSSHTIHEAARSLGADFILTKYQTDYSAAYAIDFLKMMYATMHKDNDNDTKSPVTFSAAEMANNRPKPSPLFHKLTNQLEQKIQNVDTDDNPKTKTKGSDEIVKIRVKDIPEHVVAEYLFDIVNKLGITPKSIGFKYIIDAALVKFYDPSSNFYPFLGEKYRKSDPSIERSMQYAINSAWRTSDPDVLSELYTARISSERGVPTIMEFIYFLANKAERQFKISRL